MIRVQISAYDPSTKNFPVRLGFDNASFLYKASFVSTAATGAVIQLQSTPVDDAHQPANGQAVEILTSSAQLKSGDYTASLHGFVGQTASYDVTNNQITLQAGDTSRSVHQFDNSIVCACLAGADSFYSRNSCKPGPRRERIIRRIADNA